MSSMTMIPEARFSYVRHSALEELRHTLRLPLDAEILVDEQDQFPSHRGSNMAYGAH
jgi:hypothetical protein